MGNLFAYGSPLWKATDKIIRLLWLSILWAICSLPIITIGASTTALYSVTLKYVKNEESYLTSAFFHAYKQNLKQGLQIWLLSFISGLVLFIGILFYFRWEKSGVFPFVMTTAFLSLFVSFHLTNIFVFPLLAKFENTSLKTIQNALIMALTHLPSGISMLVITIAVIMIGTFVFPPLLLAAPATIAYINSCFLVKIFDQYLSDTNAGKEAAL